MTSLEVLLTVVALAGLYSAILTNTSAPGNFCVKQNRLW